jgi:hypothetical protein
MQLTSLLSQDFLGLPIGARSSLRIKILEQANLLDQVEVEAL